MLSSLHIRNYVLIDSLDIDFPGGLVIITGQTGAGKSILLGALSLVAGAKADATHIAPGASSCVVEAEFDVPDQDGVIRSVMDENDAEWDGGHVIVRRVVNASGRSRCFIGDTPVPVQVLQELASHLIDIHSQHQSLLLTDRAFQLSMLDRYASDGDVLAVCRDAWQQLQTLRRERADLQSRIARVALEKDYNEAQFNELEAAGLKSGEIEALEDEQRTLSNAEQILEDLSAAASLFAADESHGLRSMSSALKEAGRLVSHVCRFMPALESLCTRIDTARIELDDISAEIEDAASRVNVSSDRLEQVDARLSALYKLLTKHGCRTVDELIALRDSLSESICDSSAMQDRLDDLDVRIDGLQRKWQSASDKLHELRTRAADGFAADILRSLRFLELDRSVFAIDLNRVEGGPSGEDQVVFKFSASGLNPVDVAKCASGGELSRIMLSLKAMMAGDDMPTMIFDEIDTGVSGSVADKMGSMICTMGERMQIFSITHLPQVAAKGMAHYVVSKHFDSADGAARSEIHKVEGEMRVAEIARLLSGASVTPEAVANARALLTIK